VEKESQKLVLVNVTAADYQQIGSGLLGLFSTNENNFFLENLN